MKDTEHSFVHDVSSKWLDRLDLIGFDRVLLAIHFRLKCGCVFDCQDCKGLAMARSSKLITLCVALVAFVALRSVAFLGAPGPQAQLRGTPLEIAAGAAVPAVLMTPTAAMAADGGMPSVVLGVGILCMLAAFSAVSSVISATVTSELDWVSWKIRPFSSSEAGRCRKMLAPSLHPLVNLIVWTFTDDDPTKCLWNKCVSRLNNGKLVYQLVSK